MKRWQVLLIAVIAIGLVARGIATPDPAAASGRTLTADAIGEIVGSANPHLAAATRQRIGRAILRSSADYALDPQLVTAIVLVESGARPWALSGKGAVGLMQVMPHMSEARILAGNLTTIESNVAAGCSILADNIRRLGEDDGISAYFWGSDIRGVAYLDRVRAARATVRRLVES
jgi:soluble lytic murein transglycosylase-like protein